MRQFAQPKKSKGWRSSHKNYKLYNSHRWRKASKRNLKKNPLCWQCKEEGRTTPATVTDHTIPIEEGGSIWNPLNWGSMCDSCHNSKSRQEQDGRIYRAIGTISNMIPIRINGKLSKVAR